VNCFHAGWQPFLKCTGRFLCRHRPGIPTSHGFAFRFFRSSGPHPIAGVSLTQWRSPLVFSCCRSTAFNHDLHEHAPQQAAVGNRLSLPGFQLGLHLAASFWGGWTADPIIRPRWTVAAIAAAGATLPGGIDRIGAADTEEFVDGTRPRCQAVALLVLSFFPDRSLQIDTTLYFFASLLHLRSPGDQLAPTLAFAVFLHGCPISSRLVFFVAARSGISAGTAEPQRVGRSHAVILVGLRAGALIGNWAIRCAKAL